MTDTFLGVQPIFDRERQVVAYELLFRNAHGGLAGSGLDGDSATSQVIINAFADIGVERLGRDKKLFINLTDGLLAGGLTETLPPQRVVLEILETVKVTPELVVAVQKLVGAGFEIALDDFVYAANWDPLIALSTIIKLDVLGDDEDAMRAKLDSIPGPRRPRLLAEKVESNIQFVQCLNMGFDLFQGFYLARPRVISGKRPPENRLLALKMLARLQDDDISLQEVELLISQDVSLSYRLLRFLGNVAVSQGRPIHNLKQAISLVGLRTIRQWAALIVLGSLESQSPYSFTRSLTFARFCQMVGERHLPSLKDALFTVGLFSSLDEILGVPLADALAPLPLDASLKDAILRHAGTLGQILASAAQIESVEAAGVDLPAGLDAQVLSTYFIEAFVWAQEIQAELAGAASSTS
ncbi:HDOD domain-containing protein [Thiorhodococcus mannitoliphagus]|uniref:HDOD domain-containing protein n=1 Tax=Thiorhodococcus mannitoliphagus TaxID=329406 RepID=A0A6P1E2Q9_9GAMM|nr:HDOD domain-containing protein [Thiorhodococcus mannitoliphagus]NEX21975.1 HDOD domain-containing protein [Thiorhodococcus mannitoliphagus]